MPRDYLSTSPPYCALCHAAMVFLVSQSWPIGCDSPFPFSERFLHGEHAKWRCDPPPPKKGYPSYACLWLSWDFVDFQSNLSRILADFWPILAEISRDWPIKAREFYDKKVAQRTRKSILIHYSFRFEAHSKKYGRGVLWWQLASWMILTHV